MTIEITRDNFETQVLQTKTNIARFLAGWCAPCKQLSPILEELSGNLPPSHHWKNRHGCSTRIGTSFQIQSFNNDFHGRQPTQDAIQGALPKKNLVAKIKTWLPALAGPEVTAEELSNELTRNPQLVVLDIRAENHFVRSHILGYNVWTLRV